MKILVFNILFLLLLPATLLEVAAQPTVLITYHSKTGHTKAMAEAIAKGAASVQGINVVLKTVNEITHQDLINADAVIVGSPVYNANIAPEVSEFIASWPFENAPMKNKVGAAFVTAGGISAGEELAMMNILHSMLIFNMIIIGGDDWTAPFGASAVSGEAFEDGLYRNEFLLKGENLGKRVAGLVIKLVP